VTLVLGLGLRPMTTGLGLHGIRLGLGTHVRLVAEDTRVFKVQW